MDYTLSLTFLTALGDKSTLSISDVKESITEEDVNTLMNLIIEKNVFISKNSSFSSKSAAQLTEKNVTKFTV